MPLAKKMMTYLTNRFHNIIRKHGGFRKEGNPPHVATASDHFHKYRKVGHFIRDYPMLNGENKEYHRP